MKIQTKDLIGPALDWAVAKCEGHDVVILTAQEQRDRWFEHVPPEKLAQETQEYDTYFAPTVRPKLCVAGDEGYKRMPSHSEALMLFGEGPPRFQYSTSWSQGGPIIEREKLELRPGLYHSELWACWGQTQHGERNSNQGKTGPTPLVAAMRCYVASKLGEEVDVPEEVAAS